MIKWIIILVIILLVLSALGYSLPNLFNSPTTQANFSYVWNAIVSFWNAYLKAPVDYLWNIFVVYIWDPAINNLEQRVGPASTISNLSATSTL